MVGMKPLTISIFIFFSILFGIAFLTSGITIHIVLSDSMANAYFTGDLVTIDTRYEPSELKVGDVILYKLESREITVIHRIYDIHVVNEEYYFAVKGDANDQPDFIEEQDGVINRKIEIEFHEEDEYIKLNVTASYYDKDFIIGRIVQRFPTVGWFFVPFYSYWQPFTLIAVLVIIGIVFFGLYRLNKYLNDNFNRLFIFFKRNGKLMVNGDISTLNLSLILVFAGILTGTFMMVTTTSGNLTREIKLVHDDFSDVNVGNLLNATYSEDIRQTEAFYHNSNFTTLEYQLNSTGTIENRLHVHKVNNYSIFDMERDVEGIETLDYDVVLDQDYFITFTSDSGLFALHTFPDHLIAVNNYKEQAGFITGGYYYTATRDSYYHSSTGTEYQIITLTREYHFIQNLFVYNGRSTLSFDLETGFLIIEDSIITIDPWAVPDISALAVSVIFAMVYYAITKKRKEKILENKFSEMIMITDNTIGSENVIEGPSNMLTSSDYDKGLQESDDNDNGS
ncbi:MAG: signal peptidase I [Candidatus Hodarchaeales archaeon]|jgi:signal peptidase